MANVLRICIRKQQKGAQKNCLWNFKRDYQRKQLTKCKRKSEMSGQTPLEFADEFILEVVKGVSKLQSTFHKSGSQNLDKTILGHQRWDLDEFTGKARWGSSDFRGVSGSSLGCFRRFYGFQGRSKFVVDFSGSIIGIPDEIEGVSRAGMPFILIYLYYIDFWVDCVLNKYPQFLFKIHIFHQSFVWDRDIWTSDSENHLAS